MPKTIIYNQQNKLCHPEYLYKIQGLSNYHWKAYNWKMVRCWNKFSMTVMLCPCSQRASDRLPRRRKAPPRYDRSRRKL